MARESHLDYELARQLGMTLDEVREQGLGAALRDSEADIAAGRLHSMEEVDDYVMSTHVALFGGSFDPPTIGHEAFASLLAQEDVAADEVWIVPCPTHMFGKDMTPASVRLEMCNLAFGDIPNVKICDYEIRNGLSGSAIDFVTSLLADPISAGRVFHSAIGMDNAHNMHRWVDHKKLLELIPFIVVPREGEEIDVTVDWYEKSPHRLLVPSQPLPLTSSTDVRKKISQDETDGLLELVTKPILDYISENRLYVS